VTGRRALASGRASLVVLGVLIASLGVPGGAVCQSPSPGASLASPGAAPAASLDAAAIAAAATRLGAMAGTLEAERLLLAELRKQLPQDRAEAEAYLANVEQLALTADPARLGVVVSRVREAAPAYLDWRDQQFATPAEAQVAFIEGGAAAFDATWTTLQDAILLTVANQIDTILDVVDAMQGGQR
jgi:hypothetical protein